MSDSGRVIGQNNPYHPNYEGSGLMDLSKLTPAPFEAKHSNQSADELLAAMRLMLDKGGPRNFLVDCGITHPDDTEPMMVAFFGNGPSGECNSLFFALARNAFDVMMRRGDGFMLMQTKDLWMVDCDIDNHGWIPGTWPDPFTALVEADQWYTKNVEGK